MNAWMSIPANLRGVGFTVCYERISYTPSNPLWRATAHRDRRTWIALGKDLESALVELEAHTQQTVTNWRAA